MDCLGDTQIILKRSLFRVDRTNRWRLVVVGFLATVVLLLVKVTPTRAASGLQSVFISLLDGSNVEGTLVSLSNDEVIVDMDGKKETIVGTSISLLRFSPGPSPKAAPRPGSKSILLELTDGSKLYAEQFTGKGNSWELQSDVFGKAILPTRSLQSLLFTPLVDEAQRIAWEDALGDEAGNDALIVIRSTGEFVRVGGTIREAKADLISFDFDDQNLDMPLERLKGLAWFQPESATRAPAVEVNLENGSVLQCKTINYANNQFEITTAGGAKLNIADGGISQIQFAAANIRWVAELPSIEATMQTPIPWEFTSSASKSVLLPRFVQYRNSNRVNKELLPIEERGLLFASTGTYVFRMPDGFRTLQATVTRPELASYRSELLIEVWQEDEKLFTKLLSSSEDTMDVKVSVVPEKKTKLSVLSTGKSNLGTEVQWKQLRVLR